MIREMREWAARAEETLYIVVVNGHSVALFKEDIDDNDTDEKLLKMLRDRVSAPRTVAEGAPGGSGSGS
jgi:hypothetical protein